MILLRRLLGDVLRERRRDQGRTLREVSGAARVSLGYLSEVERGQKEASSELLGSICEALDVPLSERPARGERPPRPRRAGRVDSIPRVAVPAPAPSPLHVTNVAA